MKRPSLERQLFSNQLWETVAFIAKAAFMLGLTPWMIRVWGAKGYGEFALASSAFVLFSLVDLGIRAKTRVALCNAAQKDRAQWPTILAHSTATFAVIGLLTIVCALILNDAGVWPHFFHITSPNRNLMVVAATFSILVMLSNLLLEPLVALGHIGKLKLATAIGWLVAIPGVAIVLIANGPVIAAVTVWLGMLLCANLLLLLHSGRSLINPIKIYGSVSLRDMIAVLRGGFWFTVINTTWISKTYGTTLLISALFGPTAAGTFFIALRLSEVITALGAISCDVSLTELAKATTVEERRHCFEISYSWAALLSTHLAIVIGFSTFDFYQVWLRASLPVASYVGAVVAAIGLSGALNRKAAYAAMALGDAKVAAKCGVAEATAFLALIALVPRSLGLTGILGLATLSSLALAPIIRTVSHRLLTKPLHLWLDPVVSIAPFAILSWSILLAANMEGQPIIKIVALAVAGIIAVANVIHRQLQRSAGRSETCPVLLSS